MENNYLPVNTVYVCDTGLSVYFPFNLFHILYIITNKGSNNTTHSHDNTRLHIEHHNAYICPSWRACAVFSLLSITRHPWPIREHRVHFNAFIPSHMGNMRSHKCPRVGEGNGKMESALTHTLISLLLNGTPHDTPIYTVDISYMTRMFISIPLTHERILNSQFALSILLHTQGLVSLCYSPHLSLYTHPPLSYIPPSHSPFRFPFLCLLHVVSACSLVLIMHTHHSLSSSRYSFSCGFLTLFAPHSWFVFVLPSPPHGLRVVHNIYTPLIIHHMTLLYIHIPSVEDVGRRGSVVFVIVLVALYIALHTAHPLPHAHKICTKHPLVLELCVGIVGGVFVLFP